MFEYHCPNPECKTTYDIHEDGCPHAGASRSEIEKAYVDILSVLSRLTCSKESLKENAHEWDELHESTFERLVQVGHIAKTEEGYYTIGDHSTRESKRPYSDPLATIYRHGTVSGCHDNGLFALMAFYSHIGLSWDETKEELKDWYRRTGTWERGGFSEPSPEALILKKKHIYDEGYGWKTKGQAAKEVIDRHRSTAAGSQGGTASS